MTKKQDIDADLNKANKEKETANKRLQESSKRAQKARDQGHNE